MGSSFVTIESFRNFVLSTRTEFVRTIFFTTDFQQISIFRLAVRGVRVQEDVDAIVNTLRAVTVPCWFLVRCSMEDKEWTLGYRGDPGSEAAMSFANTLRDLWFEGANFAVHPCVREQAIWKHLFPQYSLLDEHKVDKLLVLVLDNAVDPKFLLESRSTVDRFCQAGLCCFAVSQSRSTVNAQLLNPDGQLCRHCAGCAKQAAAGSVPSTVYAFMKRELAAFLGPLFPGSKICLLPDINNCGELHSGDTRRRSTAEVLSPPTLERYNQGESKRTRNFAKSPQPLFSN